LSSIALAAVVLLGVAAWVVRIYNRLIRDRNRVAQSWSDVAVQLRRRHDLVPRLVEVTKGYASFERALLESVAEMRNVARRLTSPAALTPVESDLAANLHRMIVIGEAYPELKASDNFLALQRELSETEDQIQFARRYYNGAVNLYNTRIDSVPDLLVARSMRFRPAEFFDLDTESQAAVPPVIMQ